MNHIRIFLPVVPAARSPCLSREIDQ